MASIHNANVSWASLLLVGVVMFCGIQGCASSETANIRDAELDLAELRQSYKYIGDDGYRMERYHAPTPPFVPSATTIDTEHLDKLIGDDHVALLDVVGANFRPARDGLPAAWLPTPRRHIPGSVWLPNVGFGEISEQFDNYFRRELQAATNGDIDHAVVFYCRTDCWASWNAVQRAARYGYTNLYWYPLGADGWEAEGGELVDATPIPVE